MQAERVYSLDASHAFATAAVTTGPKVIKNGTRLPCLLMLWNGRVN